MSTELLILDQPDELTVYSRSRLFVTRFCGPSSLGDRRCLEFVIGDSHHTCAIQLNREQALQLIQIIQEALK